MVINGRDGPLVLLYHPVGIEEPSTQVGRVLEKLYCIPYFTTIVPDVSYIVYLTSQQLCQM